MKIIFYILLIVAAVSLSAFGETCQGTFNISTFSSDEVLNTANYQRKIIENNQVSQMNRAGYHDSENDHGFLIIFGDGENVDFSIKFENWQQMKPTFDKICDLSTGLYDDNDQKIQHPFLILIPEGETEKISPDQVKIVIDGTLYDFETWADILPPRDRTWTEAISETASTLSESAADLTQSAGRLFGNVTGRFRKSLDNTNQARDEKIQKSPLILNWSNDQKVKSN